MEDRTKKELIAIIKEQLTAVEDRPYKEGAWEAYKSTYEPKSIKKILSPYWAAAAALALAGFVSIFIIKNTDVKDGQPAQQSALENTLQGKQTPQDNNKQNQPGIIAGQVDVESGSTDQTEHVTDLTVEQVIASTKEYSILPLSIQGLSYDHAAGQEGTGAKSLDRLLFDIPRSTFSAEDEDMMTSNLSGEFAMAQRAESDFGKEKEAGKNLAPKRFNLTNKFELGAFLSPSTTDQGFDVGGGMMLAYKLSNKLAVRTGASFNQYEVGLLASEIGSGLAGAPNMPSDAANMISKEVPYRVNSLMLPDLNAVSGKVQTLDIPLEIKYTMGKQFYATGGVSYALVLSQERFNHFTEYTDVATFSSASNSGQPTTPASSTIETAVQSSQENVNPNGFGGFVNFSVGRKTNLTKFMKISIEPYIKIPVGQFKRADMDYTNGGLRVITNF